MVYCRSASGKLFLRLGIAGEGERLETDSTSRRAEFVSAINREAAHQEESRCWPALIERKAEAELIQ